MFSWRRVSGFEYWITTQDNEFFMGPLSSEKWADKALECLNSSVSEGVSYFKSEFPESFSEPHLREKVVHLAGLLIGENTGVVLPCSEVERICLTLAKDYRVRGGYDWCRFLPGGDFDLWCEIESFLTSMPAIDFSQMQKALKEAKADI